MHKPGRNRARRICVRRAHPSRATGPQSPIGACVQRSRETGPAPAAGRDVRSVAVRAHCASSRLRNLNTPRGLGRGAADRYRAQWRMNRSNPSLDPARTGAAFISSIDRKRWTLILCVPLVRQVETLPECRGVLPNTTSLPAPQHPAPHSAGRRTCSRSRAAAEHGRAGRPAQPWQPALRSDCDRRAPRLPGQPATASARRITRSTFPPASSAIRRRNASSSTPA